LEQIEDEINAALAACIPEQMLTYKIEVAIDEHDEPYYGDKAALAEYVIRSKAKAGTTRFFRIITLYAIYRQMRVSVAVAFVLPGDETVSIVRHLLQRAQGLKLQIRVLYLDRGYCSGAVITYLQQSKQPAILACTIRGKTGGTRQLCRGRKSYLLCPLQVH
jgi:putative transposase